MRCALRAFIHPWELGLLQAVEKFVLFHGVCELVTTFVIHVQFNPLVKTPVVSKTCDSRMLEKGTSLHVVGVEFISICFMDQH